MLRTDEKTDGNSGNRAKTDEMTGDNGSGGRAIRAGGRATTQARGRGASYTLYPTLTPNGGKVFVVYKFG